MAGLLETTALEPFFWTVMTYAVLRGTLRDEPNWFIGAGVVTGIALQGKYTIAFWAVALIAGVLAAGPRRVLRCSQFWLGSAAAVAASPVLQHRRIYMNVPFFALRAAAARDG